MEIERVFVARRPLFSMPKTWQKFRYAAHSALLLRTKDDKYHILEYMADSKAHLYEIKLDVIRTIQDPPHEIFKLAGVEWTKQLYGKACSGWTLEQAQLKMQELMKDGYKLTENEVCHVAQERLRREMGIMEDSKAEKESDNSDPDPDPDPRGPQGSTGTKGASTSDKSPGAGSKVNELKMQGNASLKSGDVKTAIKLYTRAIELDPTNHILYSNRSMACCKASKYERALQDAETSIRLNPNWTKGHYHKGTALTRLKRFSEAAGAYEKALKLEPKNQEIKTALSAVNEKLVAKRIAVGLSKGSNITDSSARPPTKAEIEQERYKATMDELHSEKKIRTLLKTGNSLDNVPPAVRKALANCTSKQNVSSTEQIPAETYVIHREKVTLPSGAVRCLSLHTRLEFSHETVTGSGKVKIITRYYNLIYEWK